MSLPDQIPSNIVQKTDYDEPDIDGSFQAMRHGKLEISSTFEDKPCTLKNLVSTSLKSLWQSG